MTLVTLADVTLADVTLADVTLADVTLADVTLAYLTLVTPVTLAGLERLGGLVRRFGHMARRLGARLGLHL